MDGITGLIFIGCFAIAIFLLFKFIFREQPPTARSVNIISDYSLQNNLLNGKEANTDYNKIAIASIFIALLLPPIGLILAIASIYNLKKNNLQRGKIPAYITIIIFVIYVTLAISAWASKSHDETVYYSGIDSSSTSQNQIKSSTNLIGSEIQGYKIISMGLCDYVNHKIGYTYYEFSDSETATIACGEKYVNNSVGDTHQGYILANKGSCPYSYASSEIYKDYQTVSINGEIWCATK